MSRSRSIAVSSVVLVAALIGARVPGLRAQEAGGTPDEHLAAWLAERDVAPGSVRIVDGEVGEGREALLLRIASEPDRPEYWTVSRPVSDPDRIRCLGLLSFEWGNPSIEAIVEGDVYVRKFNLYGAATLHRYTLAGDGVVVEGEIPPPQPGPVAVHGDSAYAAWSLGREGQVALAVSMADGGATTDLFRIEEPIESIRLGGDSVAFMTERRAIVRHSDGGWGGYRAPGMYRPPGTRLLHPSLPQFRIVPGGLAELRLRDTLFIPLDFPDFEQFRRARPDHLSGMGEGDVRVDVEIGPVTDDGSRVWFGLTFYDGEGLEGVGGIGWLDPMAREAELVYPPEMADYSVSAIAVDGGELFLGLAVRSEGATHGRGLARYDPERKTFERILESAYIGSIAVAGDRILAASDRGLLKIRPDRALRRWQVFPPGRPGAAPPVVVRLGLGGD